MIAFAILIVSILRAKRK
ncbi:MAG: hypothetical protein FWE69_03845 [Clostridiales bacterium]|nr:hypothetical protein [Clostridiales bacterium]